MRELELLAPAGDLDTFKSVIDAGADAVYFGGSMFSARAYANNFDFKESEEALKYAHLHGKKAYLTLNTLIKNKEFIDSIHDYVRFYYENGLDGIIVQDIGLIKYIKESFSDLHIHGSTQLAVCNTYGAKLLKEQGLTRIVPARELSFDEIRTIHEETGMKIEAFVHGALCYSYSGDCLMSSIIGGRSGNRGRCAQPCRLEYDVLKNGKKINNKGGFVLSLKDLCGINELPLLYNSGVSSLKIEGRMKKRQYAAGVVSVYRRYIDYMFDNLSKGIDEYKVDKSDYDLLLKLGNRSGFTNSYYYNRSDNMVTFNKPSHESEDVDGSYEENKLLATCKFVARTNEPIEITIDYKDYSVSVTGNVCEKAKNKSVSLDDITKRLNKTGQSHFVFSDIEIDMDEDIFIPLGDINRIRRSALEYMEEQIIAKYNRKYDASDKNNYFLKSSESNSEIRDNSSNKEKISTTIISVSNMSQLEGIESSYDGEYDLIIPFTSFELFIKIDEIRKTSSALHIFVEFPYVIRKAVSKLLEDNIDYIKRFDGYVVSGYDAVGFVKEHDLGGIMIAGSHLYTYNRLSVDFINELGASFNVCPIELNNKELSHRDNSSSIITIYGKAPLMISANCIAKNCIGCEKREQELTLRDKKGHDFLVLNKCKVCYNVIYNGLPTCLFNEIETVDKLGFDAVRLDFTSENKDTVSKVLREYKDCRSRIGKVDFEYTTAHFKRGVI